MNTSELVKAVMLKATGKVRPMQPTDTKYQRILGIANMYIRQWQNEPGVDWSSLYDPEYVVGVASTATTYEINTDEVLKISDVPGDVIRIRKGNLQYFFETVPADRLNLYSGFAYCAQVGDTLRFAKQPLDIQIGGQILAPVYLRAELLTTQTSIVPIDDPMWLVVVSAAEYVRNETADNYKYPDLIAEANQLMQRMVENNGAQVNQLYAPSIPGISDV